MKKEIFTILAALSLSLFLFTPPHTDSQQFSQWQKTYSVYFETAAEQFYRGRIFHDNLKKIQIHNRDSSQAYQMGVNQFTVLTQSEFQAIYLTDLHIPESIQVQKSEGLDYEATSIDWESQGAVTAIKDEGQCGACWAFSTTGAVEGVSKIKDGTLKSISEQMLIDCSSKYGNFGCNGGFMVNSYNFIKDNGITEDSVYPYAGRQQTCKISTGPFKISGYSETKDCNGLVNLLTKGPVSVGVNAISWSTYKSGILNNCSDSGINFAALLVGVTESYWRVKNIWGPNWGEKGYIRLAPGNTCSICSMASIPYK